MAAQWVTDRACAAFDARPDAARAELEQVRRVRAWLQSLDLEGTVLATIDEPLAALEDGLHAAARGRRGPTVGNG